MRRLGTMRHPQPLRATSRLLVASGIAVGLQVWLGAAPQSPSATRTPPTTAEIESVLTAHAGGDDHAVERWLSASRWWSLESRRDFEAVVRQSDVPRRARLVFVLESAVAIVRGPDAAAASRFLKVGHSLLADGAQPLGTHADDDRFELLWHHLAIAAIEGAARFEMLHAYLEDVHPRFEAARRRGAELPSRLPLARAIAAAGICCRVSLPGQPIGLLFGPTREIGSVDGALLLFKDASAIPNLRVEALIRGGVMLAGRGRRDTALEWLDRVPAHDDAPLGYVQHLTRGHLLDEMQRPADAAAAYRRASEYEPTAQVATIGMAAALLRSGQVESARRAADGAKQMLRISVAADPRLIFRLADARYIPQWLAEIRRLTR